MNPESPRALAGRRAFRVATGVVLAFLVAGCAAGESTRKGPGGNDSRYVAGNGASRVIKVGGRKPAPQISGTTIEDKPLNMADLKGKVTVVNFWASWCSPCRAEAPSLQKLYTQHKDSGVTFVGIDTKDGKDNARAFARSFKITYPSLYDQAGRIALRFRDVPPNAVPSTLIIDRHGKIAARVIGGVTFSRLRALITKVAAEK